MNSGMPNSFATRREFLGRLERTISMKAIGSRWVLRMVRSGQHRPLTGADWYSSITTYPAPLSTS